MDQASPIVSGVGEEQHPRCVKGQEDQRQGSGNQSTRNPSHHAWNEQYGRENYCQDGEGYAGGFSQLLVPLQNRVDLWSSLRDPTRRLAACDCQEGPQGARNHQRQRNIEYGSAPFWWTQRPSHDKERYGQQQSDWEMDDEGV